MSEDRRKPVQVPPATGIAEVDISNIQAAFDEAERTGVRAIRLGPGAYCTGKPTEHRESAAEESP